MRIPVAIAFAAALFATATPADAQLRVKVGVLHCHGSSTSYVLSSATALRCTFHPSHRGRVSRYDMTMHRLGLDIGTHQRVGLSWIVFALTGRHGPGALQGGYVGASANAAIGVGGGANVLLGGLNNSFALQPVSLQGQQGVAVAAGVTAAQLVYRRR